MNEQMLVDKYGTPAYVYDLSSVRRAYTSLTAALPQGSLLYYSLKANPFSDIVHELHHLGCHAEICSIGELEIALAQGHSPNSCLYTGPGKTARELDHAIRHGVTLFSVESPRDLQRLSDAAQKNGTVVKVLIRVNPDESIPGPGLSMTGVPSQFGADSGWIRDDPAQFGGTPWATLHGFHFYTGTNLTSVESLLHSFEVALRTAWELSRVLGFEIQLLDLGGGFGHPYAVSGAPPSFAAMRAPLEDLLDGYLSGWRDQRPRIAFEAGRYLVASCGTLLCTVQDVKQSKGRTYITVDSGIHHIGGMSGLRRLPQISPALLKVNFDGKQAEGQTTADVVGLLCTPLDCLARGAELPEVVPGDLLAIPNVGAYGLTASLVAFLSREAPVEIVVDGELVRSASRLVIERQSCK